MTSDNSRQDGTTRRVFLKGSALAAAGVVAGQIAAPAVHAAGNDTIRVGLIGCGGRGTGAAGQALSADKGAVLVAMGDVFEDKLKSSLNSLKRFGPEKVKVDDDHCFVGFDAYKKVIDSVDLVVLTTPPGFRPMHLRAAVEAGKHVFLEKPVAVDVPGILSVKQSAAIAKEKNLGMVCGFCWRYSLPERAVFQRIQEGAIGDIVAHYGTYNTGGLWMNRRQEKWSDMEWQLRNWLYFTWLSGDHIVEQAVHTIDKLGWATGDKPALRATAHGGRQARTDPAFGHIFDHFAVVYDFPNEVKGFIFCRQQDGCSSDTSDTIMGTKGTARILPSRSIRGAVTWKYEGENPNMYQVEHNELFASIRAGKPLNDGNNMVNSTMLAILGRMAAYTGQSITWEKAMSSQENLLPERLEFGALPTPAVAIPGKTKFI